MNDEATTHFLSIINNMEFGSNFPNQFMELWSKIGVGLGGLRAVAQGCSYSLSKIELGC